jgi:hypothetical protein
VVIKTPSVDMQANPAALERFMLEEWIARRINSAHVLKPCRRRGKRNYIYVVTEYIEGQTLAQWLIDNPKPDLPPCAASSSRSPRACRPSTGWRWSIRT